MEKLKGLLKSRKFWAAIVGLGLIVFEAYDPKALPFDAEQVTNVVYILAAYIVGVALDKPK